MKKILFIICAMLMTCVSVVNAQDLEKIEFTGKLINPVTSVDDYRIRLYETGKTKFILEEVRAREDGTFYVSIRSDRAVRFAVLDKKKNIVFSRVFFGTADNHMWNFNEIDLSRGDTTKSLPNP